MVSLYGLVVTGIILKTKTNFILSLFSYPQAVNNGDKNKSSCYHQMQLMENIMLDLLKKYEADYAENRYEGKTEAPVHLLTERNSQVILTAPHATRTFRNQKIKKPDLYTGSLTRLLGEKNNVSTVIRNCFIEEKSSITDFITKNSLEQHYFFDIHGMHSEREFALAVGTGILPAESYTPILHHIDILAKTYKFPVVINHPDYTGKFGLTGDLQKITGNAHILQFEWRLDYRDFYNHPDRITNITIPFISELIHYVEESYS